MSSASIPAIGWARLGNAYNRAARLNSNLSKQHMMRSVQPTCRKLKNVIDGMKKTKRGPIAFLP
jgi:hypothetical protein